MINTIIRNQHVLPIGNVVYSMSYNQCNGSVTHAYITLAQNWPPGMCIHYGEGGYPLLTYLSKYKLQLKYCRFTQIVNSSVSQTIGLYTLYISIICIYI